MTWKFQLTAAAIVILFVLLLRTPAHGVALYQELAAGYTAKATLPTSGDYRLEIRSSGRYTAGVMIK